MCGIAGAFGAGWDMTQLDAMVRSQLHRGPDATGVYVDPSGQARLGHCRLSVIDLSPDGRQPMSSADSRLWIVFNGEIYNYLELRAQLGAYPFRTRTDTEVVLAAYDRWGESCLDRFVGMFAFLIWDARAQRLFAARDRFGVKPLCYHESTDGMLAASEPRGLHAGGVTVAPDEVSWATYLAGGHSDYSDRTFWKHVKMLPPGHTLTWHAGRLRVNRWYDLADRVGLECDRRQVEAVQQEYTALLLESVRLRFRSDVPVGINLSGGIDSSVLLRVVQAVQGPESDVKAFTFVSGDPRYDELPWVRRMLARTQHPSVVCRLSSEEVPELAAAAQEYQDAPFGGLPTLAYGRIFERARSEGVIVLLDGQGMDEQWAGYDYYRAAVNQGVAGLVQGTRESPVRPDCLTPAFRALAEEPPVPLAGLDPLRQLQYRDARYSKLPRALRFNDRISMQYSTELREPFLDHRLFELAFRQPAERKLRDGTSKWLLRRLASRVVPAGVRTAPKRPLQTPQREWLRGPLRDWASANIDAALSAVGGAWLQEDEVRRAWERYTAGRGDTSFFVWQWVNLGLLLQQRRITRTSTRNRFAVERGVPAS